MRISIEELIIWFSTDMMRNLGQFNWLLQSQPNYNYVCAWNLSPGLLIQILLVFYKCNTCS